MAGMGRVSGREEHGVRELTGSCWCLEAAVNDLVLV